MITFCKIRHEIRHAKIKVPLFQAFFGLSLQVQVLSLRPNNKTAYQADRRFFLVFMRVFGRSYSTSRDEIPPSKTVFWNQICHESVTLS
jgi:hypothetical protein|nr:MAG TPA: hypothetical protein [Caudoviricetes sp.]